MTCDNGYPPCYTLNNQPTKPMTPNWQHHSNKAKKTKGMCKAQLKARRQSLKALKLKLSA